MQKYPYLKEVGFSDEDIDKIYQVIAEYARKKRKEEQLTKQEVFKRYGFSDEDINRFYKAENKNSRERFAKKQNKTINHLPEETLQNKKMYLLYHDHGFTDEDIEKLIDVHNEVNQKYKKKEPVDKKEVYRKYGFNDEVIKKIYMIKSGAMYEKQKNKANEADIFLKKLRKRLLNEKRNFN